MANGVDPKNKITLASLINSIVPIGVVATLAVLWDLSKDFERLDVTVSSLQLQVKVAMQDRYTGTNAIKDWRLQEYLNSEQARKHELINSKLDNHEKRLSRLEE